eukprot:gene590-5028_t
MGSEWGTPEGGRSRQTPYTAMVYQWHEVDAMERSLELMLKGAGHDIEGVRAPKARWHFLRAQEGGDKKVNLLGKEITGVLAEESQPPLFLRGDGVEQT